MTPETFTPNRIEAGFELTELLHAWMVRWVKGHVEGDRYSCGAPRGADLLLEGLVLRKKPRS